MTTTHIIKIYIKGRRRALAKVECSAKVAEAFDKKLDDDAISVLPLGCLRIPRSSINYVDIREKHHGLEKRK